ncbi:MAG TPA: chromate transporter [Bacillota bacterium]
MNLWSLFLAFFRIGLLGFGGGPSSIPLIQIEAVTNFHWLSMDEFTDMLGMANALPGPIFTKLAGSIGYKVSGWPGVIVAELGVVLPSMLAMILLWALFVKFKDLRPVQGMINAIKPVVIVLLAMLIIDMWPKSMGKPVYWAVAVVSFGLAYFLKVHQAIVVVGALVFGAVFLR